MTDRELEELLRLMQSYPSTELPYRKWGVDDYRATQVDEMPQVLTLKTLKEILEDEAGATEAIKEAYEAGLKEIREAEDEREEQEAIFWMTMDALPELIAIAESNAPEELTQKGKKEAAEALEAILRLT